MIKDGYNALGFAEVFFANPTTSKDWFKLAQKALDANAIGLAHSLLALSYKEREREIRADADLDPLSQGVAK